MPRLDATDEIRLTGRQRQALIKLTKQHKAEQRLVDRAKILLLADQPHGNSYIARFLHLKRDTVIKWRRRWKSQTPNLSTLEAELDDKRYTQQLLSVLADLPRTGAPIRFQAEAVCQILAVACSPPDESDRPLTHWSPTALRDEVLKQGIVPSISARTVGRFLKSGTIKTPSNAKLDSAEDRKSRGL